MLRHEADDQAAEIIGLLDEFQAAERAGAEAVDHWVTVCRDARLRGGLKVIRTRDRGHACLAEERLRALGGTPSASVGRQLASLLAMLGSEDVSDRTKLVALLDRFPGELEDPLAEVVRRIGHDDETRSLLSRSASASSAAPATPSCRTRCAAPLSGASGRPRWRTRRSSRSFSRAIRRKPPCDGRSSTCSTSWTPTSRPASCCASWPRARGQR